MKFQNMFRKSKKTENWEKPENVNNLKDGVLTEIDKRLQFTLISSIVL